MYALSLVIIPASILYDYLPQYLPQLMTTQIGIST